MRVLILFLASIASAFAAPLSGNKITSDGTYTVTTQPGQRYVFSASGTFGGGSLAIQWNDGTTATAFANSPATAAETWTFTAPSKQVDLVLSGATDPSITIGLTLATGNTVDNSAVAAAIAEDPAAVLAASGAAPNRILAPNAAVKLRAMAVNQAYTQLTVMGLGDSLANRIVSGMEKKLSASPGIVGFALDALSNQVTSGTVVAPGLNSAPNFQPTIFDSGRVWNMSSGGVLRIARPGAPEKPVLSAACVIWAAKQPGGGTLTLEYSNDGGSTWISSGLTGSNTVSTDGTAGEVARISVTHGEARYRFWRVSASGGPVNYIGAKIWNSYASGIILAVSPNGGLRVDQAIQGQAAIRNQIGSDLGQTLALIHFHEGAGEADQAEISEFLGNWSTALPASDLLVIGQTANVFDPSGSNRDIVNGYWKTAIAANPRADFVDVEGMIPDSYMTGIGWNSPDNLHKDDDVWQSIGARLWTLAVGGGHAGLTANAYAITGSGQDYVFGSMAEQPNGVQTYMFPVSSAGRGRLGMVSQNGATGANTYWEAFWQPATHAKIPNGVAIRSFGQAAALVTIDATGSVRFGPYDASFPSAYTDGPSRVQIVEDYNIKGCLSLNHTSASATWLQRWALQGATQAEMREDGELNLKTITTPAAYADDAAAGAAGIPVGGVYRKTDGTVVWRQS